MTTVTATATPQNKHHGSASKPKTAGKRRIDVHEFKLLKAKNDSSELRFDTIKGTIYGKVVNFDKFSVVVLEKKSNQEMVIFKHSIVTFTSSEHDRT